MLQNSLISLHPYLTTIHFVAKTIKIDAKYVLNSRKTKRRGQARIPF
jgi:hypothetical protein